MPQKDKLKRQEYNKLQYLKNKEKKETLEVKPTPTPTPTPTQNVLDNYYLLKFFKNIRKVNKTFMNIKLKPVVNKVQVNLKEAIINELKIYQEKNKNKYESIRFKYKYIIIDLKLSVKLNSYIYGTDEPQYTGKCYNIFYVNRTNKKLLGCIRRLNLSIDSEHYFKYKYLSHKETYEKYREVEEYYKIHCPDYKEEGKLDTWLSYYVYNKEGTRCTYYESENELKRDKYFNSESNKPTELNTIKMRKTFKQMDYSSTPIYHYSAKNIKFWDKKTQKPSNKGLEIDRTFNYIYERGWKLNGITLDEIKVFCHSNGLDKKISKNYKYGDYANWILKDLN